MLELIDDLPQGLLGVRATGKVSRQDYDEVFEPLLAEARRERRRVRLLYHIAPGFESFALGAAWADMQIGLRYIWQFQRCAVVTDRDWIRRATDTAAPLFPCPVKTFGEAEWSEAVGWLAAPTVLEGFSYRLIEERELLVVEPHGKLGVEAFEALAATVDPWIDSGHDLSGLVIHAREFPGWGTIGSFLRHVQFIRRHKRGLRRVALCMDGKFAKLAPALAEIFVAAEIRHFAYAELEQASDWAGTHAAGRAPGAAER